MTQQSKSNILLMTKDSTTVNTLKVAVNDSQHVALTAVCEGVSELMSYLANTVSQAIIVDIDPDPVRTLHDVGTITTMYPEMRTVVLSSTFDNELILEAMRSGARYFLCKKSMASELNKVLRQIAPNGTSKEVKPGFILSVISASGGCGATTVAINLANELRLASSGMVLMIDLDDYYGTASSYLGISAEYGISDVLSRSESIDEHLVKSCAYNYMRDFHVLINHNNIAFAKRDVPQYENLVPALEACKKAYKYTIVDAPRLTEGIIADLANVSELVLIVFQLAVKDMKFARSLITSIQSHIPSEKIILLANRFKKRGSLIRLEDGKRVLGLDRLYHIRSDWHEITNCINRGKPLAEIAPRSGLRKDFQKLTANIINAAGSNGNGKI
jgi:pilus assembly protein CpaE